MKKLTTEEFVKRARLIHKDKYGYNDAVYKGMFENIKIWCPVHGFYEQTPSNHLKGYGCTKCSGNKQHNTQEFVQLARLKHGNTFDYSDSVYINATTKVLIRCNRCGETFEQTPANHLHGRGCPHCCRKNKALFSLRKKKFGIAVNDYNGSTKNLKSYLVWNHMLERCYDESLRYKFPTYKDCSVCADWLLFSNFKKWFDDNYVDGYHLDKDILIKGNKVYSPETCCFVPQEINKMLTKTNSLRGSLPIGVRRAKNGMFIAVISRRKETTQIGTYSTPEKAFMAYKEAKEKYIKQQAKSYFDRGLIVELVYKALMNYKVEITD